VPPSRFQPPAEVRASMLVLTRKINQSIMIGDQIEITVLAVSGEKVRIGIEAPRDISVFRQEVLDTMEEGEDPKPPPDPKE
jgi:carbon storage regulator